MSSLSSLLTDAQYYVLDRTTLQKTLASQKAVCAIHCEPGEELHMSHINGEFCKSDECVNIHREFPHWSPHIQFIKKNAKDSLFPLYMSYSRFADGSILQVVVDCAILYKKNRDQFRRAFWSRRGITTPFTKFCISCGKLDSHLVQQHVKKAAKSSSASDSLANLVQSASVKGIAFQLVGAAHLVDNSVTLMDMRVSRHRDYNCLERPRHVDIACNKCEKGDINHQHILTDLDIHIFDDSMMNTVSTDFCAGGEACELKEEQEEMREFGPEYICIKTIADDGMRCAMLYRYDGRLAKELNCSTCGGIKQLSRLLPHMKALRGHALANNNNWNILSDFLFKIETYELASMLF